MTAHPNWGLLVPRWSQAVCRRREPLSLPRSWESPSNAPCCDFPSLSCSIPLGRAGGRGGQKSCQAFQPWFLAISSPFLDLAKSGSPHLGGGWQPGGPIKRAQTDLAFISSSCSHEPGLAAVLASWLLGSCGWASSCWGPYTPRPKNSPGTLPHLHA